MEKETANMDGNPHYKEADRSELGEQTFVITQAVLALAWEQRTANLIALATWNKDHLLPAESRLLAERLGMSGLLP